MEIKMVQFSLLVLIKNKKILLINKNKIIKKKDEIPPSESQESKKSFSLASLHRMQNINVLLRSMTFIMNQSLQD